MTGDAIFLITVGLTVLVFALLAIKMVILHEFGHALLAKKYGLNPIVVIKGFREKDFYFRKIKVEIKKQVINSKVRKEIAHCSYRIPRNRKEHILILLGGIIVNLIFCIVLLIYLSFLKQLYIAHEIDELGNIFIYSAGGVAIAGFVLINIYDIIDIINLCFNRK